MKQKIRIRIESYDHDVIDQCAKEVVDTARRTGAKVKGPIPLPTKIERITVLSSPFIDKNAREQFEMRTHKRLIDIQDPSARTVDEITKGMNMPASVDVKIKLIALEE